MEAVLLSEMSVSSCTTTGWHNPGGWSPHKYIFVHSYGEQICIVHRMKVKEGISRVSILDALPVVFHALGCHLYCPMQSFQSLI